MMVRQHTQHLTDQWRSSKQAVVDAVIAFAATLQPSPKPGAPQRGRNERIIRGSLQLSSHKGTLWTWNTPGPWTKSKLTYNGFYLIKYAAVKIWENVNLRWIQRHVAFPQERVSHDIFMSILLSVQHCMHICVSFWTSEVKTSGKRFPSLV